LKASIPLIVLRTAPSLVNRTSPVRFQRQQLLVDEVIEDRLARFRRVEKLGIDLPRLRPQALLLLAHGLLELLLADLGVADPGHRVPGSRIAHVGIDAEEGERQRDQRQKDLDDLLVVANCVKHERKNPSDTFKTTNRGSPERAMIP
jgi:hypothetical protein